MDQTVLQVLRPADVLEADHVAAMDSLAVARQHCARPIQTGGYLMKLSRILFAVVAVAFGGSAASAQSIMVGGTYDCSGSKRVVESCDDENCQVQTLNPYAPDGKGAHLEIYRSMIAQQFAQCTVTGGTPVPVNPHAANAPPRRTPANPGAVNAPRASAAPVNPAYIAGAGAGVRFPGQAAPAAPAARLVPNSYYCTAFIGTPPNGHLATMPGFSILAGGRYRHQDGSSGTVTASGGTLEFHGGSLNGQAATYDAGASGRGTVHLYNERRSRTVIDCDGHG